MAKDDRMKTEPKAMDKWRPEGWKNPYRNKAGCWERLVYERGADAILEALKKDRGAGMVLVEDGELDDLYEEWEETLPIHGLSWEVYVARIQLKKVYEQLDEIIYYRQDAPHKTTIDWDEYQALKKETRL